MEYKLNDDLVAIKDYIISGSYVITKGKTYSIIKEENGYAL